ncbi:hypothetical protein PDIDSM_7448 [Penicillium digitatum]|nr:hypothetical protein PDIDSM_7448 [Penicillium digitatum]
MAYNAVAQVDHEVASVSSASVSRSPSPTHGHAFEQLPLDTDHIGGGSHLEAAKSTDNSSFSQLGSIIRSMTSTSYDVVEDDDYDVDPSPEERSNSLRIPPLNDSVVRHLSPETPIHSTCSEVPVPLSHPTPDLQSIQGAYKGNVTRLEESAEQLSSCSADIESEIRRIDQEKKRRSISSASNSLIHRNGAFSPAATTSSAHGSNVSPARQRSVSGARLAQLSEPAHDEHKLEVDEFPALPDLPPSQPLFDTKNDYYDDQYVPQGAPAETVLERRASVASGDTYQQARTLFTDFDGVHFTEPGRLVSLEQPPLARKPEHYKRPQAGENMVFYPAPVPRMLNLPPKLSRKANIDRDKRRTQIAGAIAAEDRKPTAVLLDADQKEPRDGRDDKRKSTVPPHLRASVFFDQPSTSLQVAVKQDSAVATLDSILDASANAPVSAFTDHPYAGHVGSVIYGKPKRKSLAKHLTGQKTNRLSRATIGQPYSTNNIDEHGDPVTSRYGSEAGNDSDRNHDEHGHERGSEDTDTESDQQSEDEEDEDEGGLDYVSPPNTLIAELELRKHELKHRRRTAVPLNGMRSTLLEIDELAQKQSDSRRQRPVALAWEGRDEDDDVPLAVLYPEKTSAENDDRPLGLIEKRELEENEPLSSRRARLKAQQDLSHNPAREKATSTKSKFASDLMAEIDSRAGIAPKEPQEVPTANEEETLAQRRSRLQKEAAAQLAPQKNPRMRRSMAALTQGRRPSQLNRQSSYDIFNQRPVTMSQFGNRMSMQQFPTQMGYPTLAGYPMAQQYGYPMNPRIGVNGMGYAPSMSQHPGPVKTDVIDRWRQSIH